MATTRTPRKRSAAKSSARKARPVVKTARAVKKATARKARPVAKQAGAAKKLTTRAVKTASPAKVAKKARTAKKRVTKTVRKAATPPTATKRIATSRARGGQRVDAITLLKQDHREVAQLFTRFERAGDDAWRTKQRLVEGMIAALSRHAGIEELVFYPAVRREVAGANSDVLEALEEHHVVKFLLHELEGLAPVDERFDAKVAVLIESVRHHVKEEEHELFPKVRKRLGRARLLDIGDDLRAAKPRVPARPHPSSPDEPPANAIVGGAVAVIDRARTAGKKVVDRVRDEMPAI